MSFEHLKFTSVQDIYDSMGEHKNVGYVRLGNLSKEFGFEKKSKLQEKATDAEFKEISTAMQKNE